MALRARKLLTLTLTSISKSHPGGILVKLLFSTLIPQCPGALSVRMIAPIYQDMMALMSMRVDFGVVCMVCTLGALVSLEALVALVAWVSFHGFRWLHLLHRLVWLQLFHWSHLFYWLHRLHWLHG